MRVGSLVECVEKFEVTPEQAFDYFGKEIIFPQIGNIYTIRSIDTNSSIEFGGGVSTFIRLEEIVNPEVKVIGGMKEPNFWIKRFRELQPPIEVSIDELLKEPQTI